MKQQIEPERMAHSFGVAEFMYRLAPKFGLIPDDMYLLGLLHDIGYINGKANHEVYGANLLRLHGVERFAMYIESHGLAPQEVLDTYKISISDIPKELVLLWIADLSIGTVGDQAGKLVSYEDRLNAIGNKYGVKSHAYKVVSETIEWLNEYASIYYI